MEIKQEERGWYVEVDGRIATIQNRSFFASEAEAQDAAGRLAAIMDGTAPAPAARDSFAVGDSVTATIDVDDEDADKVVVEGLEKKR